MGIAKSANPLIVLATALSLAAVPAGAETVAGLDALSRATAQPAPGLALARRQAASGDLTDALATLERVVLNHPENHEAWLLHASLLCRLDDRRGALIEFEALRGRERARSVAVVEQLPEAPPTMRVSELAMLGRFPHLGLLGRETSRDVAITRDAMTRAGCLDLAERLIGTLSGGERRRAFIARALAQEPRLLLLDEPTAALDASAQGEVFEVIRTLADEGAGALVVVHDLSLAAAWCDRLLLLHGGAVVASGDPREVITAEHLAHVYGPFVTLLTHPDTGRPLVVPTGLDARVGIDARP